MFDLNDCLVDRSDVPLAVQKAVECVLEETEHPFYLPNELFDRGWLIERGENKNWLFDYLLMRNGVPHPDRKKMVDRCMKYYTYQVCKSVKEVTPFDDTRMLKKVKQPLSIVTDTPMKLARRILKSTELGDLFEKRMVFANTNKVHAIRRIAEDLGTAPNQLVYVGDAPRDVCAARVVGARAVAVDRGFVPMDRILRARPNLVVKNLAMINPWLRTDRFY